MDIDRFFADEFAEHAQVAAASEAALAGPFAALVAASVAALPLLRT